MQRMIQYLPDEIQMFHTASFLTLRREQMPMGDLRMHYPETIRLLIDAYPDLTPELQKAARFIIDNPEEIGLNSMRGVAKVAGVKPATITRLTKSLGFSEYGALREPFRQRLRTGSPHFAEKLQHVQQRGESGDLSLLRELREQEISNVNQSLSNENLAVIDAAATTILDSRQVYVLGLRGSHAPAFLFHYTCQLFRDNSQLLDARAGIFADQLRAIGSRDALLVISFPPYTQLTIDAVDYAAEAGAKIIAVTDSVLSPAAHAAAHTIVTSNHSPSFYHSFTGALAVVQSLVAVLVTKTGDDAVQIVEQAEKQLSRISAYW